MPRTLALVLFGVLVPALSASGQTARREAPAPKPAPDKAGASADAAEDLRVRRATALFLLTGLADEAAKYDDVRLRARVQALHEARAERLNAGERVLQRGGGDPLL